VTSSPSNDIAARRWGNVEGLFATFMRHETNHGEKAAAGLASLLHALTLDLSQDEEEEVDAVTLSTLHGSKGLEFDVVFLIGCEEGYLPHSRTLDARATDAAPQDIEEERRLFYVGVTRARERLFLSRTRARILRGKPMARVASRFLLGVPPEMLEEREVKDVSAMSHVETAQAADALLAALASLGS
jgi:ATP-dependent DNA helicase Rep